MLGQTLGDFELLVADGASTDDTPAIIARHARRDQRVRMFRMPCNAGTAQAKNVALQHARAPYVAICDDDDRQMPERLAVQVDYLEKNPRHVMVGCLAHPFGDVDAGTPIAWLPGDDALARPRVLFQALYIDSANLFRRDLTRVLEIAGVTCSRAELELHHAISPSPFGLLPDPDYLRRHGDGIEAEAAAWIERLGRRAVLAGWTGEASFAEMAAGILRQLPQLRAAAAGRPVVPDVSLSSAALRQRRH